jgi:hypothetical protein
VILTYSVFRILSSVFLKGSVNSVFCILFFIFHFVPALVPMPMEDEQQQQDENEPEPQQNAEQAGSSADEESSEDEDTLEESEEEESMDEEATRKEVAEDEEGETIEQLLVKGKNERVHKWMAQIDQNKIGETVTGMDKWDLLRLVEMADQEIRQNKARFRIFFSGGGGSLENLTVSGINGNKSSVNIQQPSRNNSYKLRLLNSEV